MTVIHRSNPLRFIDGRWQRAKPPLPRFNPGNDEPFLVTAAEVSAHDRYVAASRHAELVLPPSEGLCGVCGFNIARCVCGPAELDAGTGPYVCVGCGREHGTLIDGHCRHCHCDPMRPAEQPHSEPGGDA
jgi:hypothetical protein